MEVMDCTLDGTFLRRLLKSQLDPNETSLHSSFINEADLSSSALFL
jgi:hypothetical protein